MAYEVAEQLGWRAPDHCIVPMASGSLYGKIYKGLKELTKLGLIEENATRMSGCQASGCSPIVTAWENNTLNFRPVRPNTIAKSLAIGNPADGYYTLKIMEETNGAGAAVSDDEVVEGIKLLAETEGIFAETAGGVTIAGPAAARRKPDTSAGRAGRRLHHRRRAQDAGGGGGRAAAGAARASQRGVVRGGAAGAPRRQAARQRPDRVRACS